MSLLPPPPLQQAIESKIAAAEWQRWFSSVQATILGKVAGTGTANNVAMFTGTGTVGNAPGLTYSSADGGFYTFGGGVIVSGALNGNAASFTSLIVAGGNTIVDTLSDLALAGTGTRLVTSTSTGVLGNATTIAGNYTFSGTLAASNLSGTNTGDQTITLTGDVTGSGTSSFAASIGANKVLTSMILNSNVTLAKIANIADQTILGNNTGGSAAPVALTASQTRTILGLGTADSPTLTALTLSGLTASLPVFTDASKKLVSNTMTGTGSVVMSASPTLTGTISAASLTLSGVATLPHLSGSFDIAGAASIITFGTAISDTGPFQVQVLGSGSTTIATKGTGFGRNMILTAGASDNSAGKGGGDLYLRPGAPSAPATAYGDVRIADQGGIVYIGGTLVSSTSGIADFILNSVGANNGTIQNDAANTWSLGYKPNSTSALGTPVLTWNSTGVVTVATRLNVNGATDTSAWGVNVANGNIATSGIGGVAAIVAFGVGSPGASNYENMYLSHSTAGALLVVSKGGTGTYRNLAVNVGGSDRLTIDASSGSVTFGSSVILSNTGRVDISALTASYNQNVTSLSKINISNTSGAGPYTLNLTSPTDGQEIWIKNASGSSVTVNFATPSTLANATARKFVYDSATTFWW